MRNTDRIKETTDKISILWKEFFPDWRFGQLVNNLSAWSENDLFYLEEDEFIELLIDFIIDIHKIIEIKREDIYDLISRYEIVSGREMNISNEQIEKFIDSNSPYSFRIDIKKDLYSGEIEVVMSHDWLTLGQFYDEVNRLNILAEEQGLNIKMYLNR